MSNISNNNPKLDPNLVFLRKLFKCSLLIFRSDDKDVKISKWRLTIAVIIMAIGNNGVNFLNFWEILVTCHRLYLSYSLIRQNGITSQDFVTISFSFQTFVSMVGLKLSFNYSFKCLILRWQFGSFQLIFDMNTWKQFGYAIFSTSRMKKRLIKIYVPFGIFATLTLSMSVNSLISDWLRYAQNDELPRDKVSSNKSFNN
jgi:hypothetical protein